MKFLANKSQKTFTISLAGIPIEVHALKRLCNMEDDAAVVAYRALKDNK